MIEDDVDTKVLSNNLKRRRSVSPSPIPEDKQTNDNASRWSATEQTEAAQRAPKRLRRSHDIPAYDAPVDATGLSSNNPLNRRMLKRAAKKARRAERTRGVDEVMMSLSGTFLTEDGLEEL